MAVKLTVADVELRTSQKRDSRGCDALRTAAVSVNAPLLKHVRTHWPCRSYPARATRARGAPDDDLWVVSARRLRASSFVIDGGAVRFGACRLLRLFPPRSKLLDLLEIENRLRKFAFSNNYHRIRSSCVCKS
jgi:hypothetical protein